MQPNRIDAELSAFHRQQFQEIRRDPELVNDRQYWAGQLALMTSLLNNFKDDPHLNAAEKASLATMKATHRHITKRAKPYTVSSVLQHSARLGGKAITGTVEGVGNLLYDRVNVAMGQAARTLPWFVQIPVQLLRIPVALTGMILQETGKGLKFLFDNLLPSPYKPPPLSSEATGEQATQQRTGNNQRGLTATQENLQQQPGQRPTSQQTTGEMPPQQQSVPGQQASGQAPKESGQPPAGDQLQRPPDNTSLFQQPPGTGQGTTGQQPVKNDVVRQAAATAAQQNPAETGELRRNASVHHPRVIVDTPQQGLHIKS